MFFYSEGAEFGLAPPGTGDRGSPPIRGMLAITDRRIYVMERKGIFSPMRTVEAIFDSNYARQLVETAKAKNEELRPESLKVNIFSRQKWMKEHGYRLSVDLLTATSLDRGMLGGNSLFLQIYHAYTDTEFQKNLQNARKAENAVAENVPGASDFFAGLASLFTIGIISSTHELQIKKPLTMAPGVAAMDLAGTGNSWLKTIIENYKQKTNVSYEPLLEIMQVKAQDISAYIKEYENSTT